MPNAARPLREASLLRRQEFPGHGTGQGTGFGHAFNAGQFAPDIAALKGIERKHLKAAIAEAGEDLDRLIRRTKTADAKLFEFQLRMLRDPELAELASEGIAQGIPVALAWADAMDDYASSFKDDDDNGLPRRMDLIDIRNRVLSHLAATPRPDFPIGAVYVADDMEPTLFLDHDWSAGGGVALRRGSAASHLAMLARARSVPLVSNLGDFDPPEGCMLLVDSPGGRVVVAPDIDDVRKVGHVTMMSGRIGADMRLSMAVNRVEDIALFDPPLVDGIGLLRTEFLLTTPALYLDESGQLEAYTEAIRQTTGPVVIRLLDLGGDKPAHGITQPERNPFLGLRGVRLLREKPELLKVQVRAVLRAAAMENVRVLLPMVTVPAEVDHVRAIFKIEAADLTARGISHGMPLIGMMVETPAAALMLDAFDADFFVIGTSDLLQYLAAASRDEEALAGLRRDALPAFIRLVEQCAARARQLKKPISACGDALDDPAVARQLYDAGIRAFTVTPSQSAALAGAG